MPLELKTEVFLQPSTGRFQPSVNSEILNATSTVTTMLIPEVSKNTYEFRCDS